MSSSGIPSAALEQPPPPTANDAPTPADQPATLILQTTEPENTGNPSPPARHPSDEAPAEQERPGDQPQSRPQSPAPALEHAYWALIEEDRSVPDEAETREIEATKEKDYSAYEFAYWEDTFFRDLDDPEYRHLEKARLTWTFKGIRGTKENPNRAKIVRSPPAYVGGYWWTIKFFPRGNNVGSLSIYLECSPTMPSQDRHIPQGEFKVLRGPPDVTLNENKTPDLHFKYDQTDDPAAWMEQFKSQYPAARQETSAKRSWRVPAQIGVILYNPAEPRTGWVQSSCHQFNPHNLDWGWTNFHGPWDQIHCRQRGQRQALLRNDSLSFDAYIGIVEDPTNALWWHASDSEPTWDSLGLTGYRPLGDSVINHSAEVAGLASWLHIAPFCKIIQSVDVLGHLSNCDVKPKPLCDALQRVLWQLRSRSESLQYVDTDMITSTLRNLNEYSSDVSEFWERLRRSLELELEGADAGKELAKLFDSPDAPVNTLPRDFNSRICIPADQASTMREALTWYFSRKSGKWALPPMLHVNLNRQKLDRVARQWRLLYNRVELDEDLDLTQWTQENQDGHYVLYGYVVHRGRRTSGKFFSILRPGGPGTRWLAFDDGSDNRVECLTRKTALGPHLGLDPFKQPDHKIGHDIAVDVMYVRSDVVKEFLPGPQGPWDAPQHMKVYYESGMYPLETNSDGKAGDVRVEVYSVREYDQMGSLFDTYDLMSRAKSSNQVMYLTVSRSSTLVDIRKKIASWLSGNESIPSERIRLWQFGHTLPRHGPTLGFWRVSNLQDTVDVTTQVARFWVQVVSNDAEQFAMPDPPKTVVQKPEESVVERVVTEPSESSGSSEYSETSDNESSGPSAASTAPTNADSRQALSENSQSSAPTRLFSGVESTQPEDSTDNDAVIAAIITNGVEEMGGANQPTQNEPETTQQPSAITAEQSSEPAVLMVHDDRSNLSANPTPANGADTPAEPAVQLPAEHVYYFIQVFDIEKQILHTVGSFFSRKDTSVKAALRKCLAWPDNKNFLIWKRYDGTTVEIVPARETFEGYVPDGTCFIVGDRLNNDKRTQYHQAGLFTNPVHLVQYLWAECRHHPIHAFTGTKTIEANFTGDYYSGEFHKGTYHGHGKHISDLAATYEGSFILNRRHGKGVMDYPSGDMYDGDWHEDQRHGQGTFIERKTGNKYVGGYKDGKRHGKGISYWEVADEEMDLCQICYGEEQDALFYDCGHVCACVTCANQVDICPICRRNVLRVVKIYRS